MTNKNYLRPVLGLVIVYIAVFLDYEWVWGILFLIWVIPDLMSGTTHFMSLVSKKENPILYWSIVITWLWMSAYVIGQEIYLF